MWFIIGEGREWEKSLEINFFNVLSKPSSIKATEQSKTLIFFLFVFSIFYYFLLDFFLYTHIKDINLNNFYVFSASSGSSFRTDSYYFLLDLALDKPTAVTHCAQSSKSVLHSRLCTLTYYTCETVVPLWAQPLGAPPAAEVGDPSSKTGEC